MIPISRPTLASQIKPYICPGCARKISTLKTNLASHRVQQQSRSSLWRQQRRWIGRNYIRKMVGAEDDFKKRAEDIESGRKRSVLEVLEERGFVNQIVGSREQLKTLLDNRRIGAYVGIDPTAPSMHVGHMIPFMALSWLYIHGYSANFLLGGATAAIGDPEGRLQARQGMNRKQRRANIASMHLQLKRFGELMEKYAARRGYQREWAWRRSVVNNSAWHSKTPIMEWMRLMGTGIRVGPMLGRDSVKNRLEKGDGMSFAELCYPLVQAWDWWELFQKGVQLQIGGADQFGNILQGAEAVKYASSQDLPFNEKLSQEKKIAAFDEEASEPNFSPPAYRSPTGNPSTGKTVTEDPVGFTVPLLTTAAGDKFGKSAGNAIWLDPDLTPPFDLYQFFLRSADADVEKYLKLFTFIPLPDITALMTEHTTAPEKRLAQHKLAREFVELIHGLGAAEEAEKQHRSLFSKNLTLSDLTSQSQPQQQPPSNYQPLGTHSLSPSHLQTPQHRPSHPSLTPSSPPLTLESSTSTNLYLPHSLYHHQPLSRILYSTGLVSSRSEGTRLIASGGVYIGGKKRGNGGEAKIVDDEVTYTKVDGSIGRWEREGGGGWGDFVVWDDDGAKGKAAGKGEGLLILRTGKWRVKIVRLVSDEVFRGKGLTAPGWAEAEEERTKREEDRGRGEFAGGRGGEVGPRIRMYGAKNREAGERGGMERPWDLRA